MLTIISVSLSLLPLCYIKTSLNWPLSIFTLLTTAFLSPFLLHSVVPLSIELNILSPDLMSQPLIILTLWISALMILASFQIKNKNKSPMMFLFFVLLLNILLILCFSVCNTIMFYIFFESTLIPTLFIIIGWGYQPERLQAGFYLMLYTVLASLPLLISITMISISNYTLSLFLPYWAGPCPPGMMNMWWLMTIMAFMAKMPLYSLHLWLPKAHVEAPVAGSMILAGLLLKLGSYGLLRLSAMFPYNNMLMASPISSLALWGAVITSMICLRQSDMKSLIAYSSIGHMGLLTAGIMSSTSWGWESSLTMMIAHGLCSSSMFALANMQYESTQTRNIFLTKGMLSMFPIMTMLWFITCCANMAAPPSLNLIAEAMLLTSILSFSSLTAPILTLTVFLSAGYSLFLYTSMQHGTPMNSINPMHLFSPRNYLIILLHLAPLFMFCLKLDYTLSWLL